jgi:hypothetical protein
MKLGSNDITLAIGNTPVDKAYLGSELVYSSATPPLPYDAEVEYIDMYDRISGELFGNAGTGDFGVGGDI